MSAFLQRQVAAGAMQPDDSQLAAAHILDRLFGSFVEHMRRPAAPQAGAVPAAEQAQQGPAGGAAQGQQRAQQQEEQQAFEEPQLQGAYLWGEVGSIRSNFAAILLLL